MRSLQLATLFLASLISTAALADKDPIPAAVADATRPQSDRDADALRNPAATIAFAGIKPGMVIGELYPCGGYFSRMLGDVVGPKGKVYGLETTRWKGCAPADQKMAAEAGRKNISISTAPFGAFSLPEKVDLFWITQNYHDLHIKEYGAVDMLAFNRHVFESLKPGGIYFILDHQAEPGLSDKDVAKLHRIEKSQVIREVTAAGFKLVAEGNFLHRAGDDHRRPIFDPAVRGKTDQYALKFRRP